MDRLGINTDFLENWESPIISITTIITRGFTNPQTDKIAEETKDRIREIYGIHSLPYIISFLEMKVLYDISTYIIPNKIKLVRGDKNKIKKFTCNYENLFHREIYISDSTRTAAYFISLQKISIDISNETALDTDEVRALLLPKKTEPPRQEKNKNEEHAKQWKELAETLENKEEKTVAQAVACKWDGMTNKEAYNTLFPHSKAKDETKKQKISRLKKPAQALAKKHGLELPECWKEEE